MLIRIKNKFLLLVLTSAVLTGILYIAPQAFIWNKLKSLQKPYLAVQYITHNDSVKSDLAKAREVVDGHFLPSELSFAPQGTAFAPFIPYVLFAFFIVIANGNISLAFLLANFIFASLIFGAIYFLGKVIIKNRWWALFLAFLGTFTPILISYYNLYYQNFWNKFLNDIVKNFYPLVNTPLATLSLSRIGNPLITYVFYLPALAAIFLFWQKPKAWTAILAGLIAGLTPYVYFHHGIFLFIVIGLLTAYSFWKRKNDPIRLKFILVLLGIFFLITIPYVISYFSFSNLPSYDDYVRRLGVEEGRNFQLLVIRDYAVYLIFAAFIYLTIYKKDKSKAILYFLFFGAMFITWNIQLITGFVPESNHWWSVFGPVIFMVSADIVYNFLRNPNSKLIIAILILLSSLLVIKKAVNAGLFINPDQSFLDKYTFSQDIIDSWNWINGNLGREPKIISDSFMTALHLHVYTSARSYLPNWLNTLASNEDVENRFLVANKSFGVSKEILEKRLRLESGGTCENLARQFDLDIKACDDRYTFYNLPDAAFHLYGRYFVYGPSKEYSTVAQGSKPFPPITEFKIQELLARFDETKIIWPEIGVEYVYYGPWEKQFSQLNLAKDANLELVYKNLSVEIYKINGAFK
ncbi:MAG: hypothetical protein A3I24_02815 [Candidatus Harrisonbacteria bacterium RIFCSPLOWO2_02_FULL_41_13b]|uniref:Glycosyltransferase RgtA/B/C/D-like domain-containing protein n=1 Tax=Candidatus Harrisonbacteria bacterium RIFCSPLOWO2_02_FULL_41_13b TaxID=1798409 RepID=A0A1G1ZSJ7_9BACT|nr:MAG: hypothetical protein A3J53_01845 [Candidatus Harrisonbacteria bacterium RIFCSPHIGHO2_02_FULL_40_20]OGY67086.1 MAG: hypothetical protein A3I24_02815 [Candidatus Harrisonbacteria bacterium RIFCSPLOWO2_02_FULL_41_13b]